MSTLLIPVVNGILPKPGGGCATGGFMTGRSSPELPLEAGMKVFVCPLAPATGALYRVGVLAALMDVQKQKLEMPGVDSVNLISLRIEGVTHARWDTLCINQSSVYAEGLEYLDFHSMRAEYPVISGAGWVPQGGWTEFRSLGDIPVTLYGNDVARNTRVSLEGNLKGLVSLEAAHTIEHAIIRSLRTYGLCTPRTLQHAIKEEAAELTWSVEKSMRYALPEVLGSTQAGACGNPMTNLAQFFMFQELSSHMKDDGTGLRAMEKVRRTVMSKLTGELGLTTEPGLRALQGLKRGMMHDDSPLSLELCKKVLRRFPLEPWQ